MTRAGSLAGTFVIAQDCSSDHRVTEAVMSTILIVILILILVGALPNWGYSRSWGYGPGGIVSVLLIIVIILALMGRL